jgi:hypothetical protein
MNLCDTNKIDPSHVVVSFHLLAFVIFYCHTYLLTFYIPPQQTNFISGTSLAPTLPTSSPSVEYNDIWWHQVLG